MCCFLPKNQEGGEKGDTVRGRNCFWKRYRNEIGSLKHRMDEVQRIVDAVHSLAQQMVAQTAEIKHLGQAVGEVKKDVAELKAKPGAHWESLITGLIGAAAGAIGAIFFR